VTLGPDVHWLSGTPTAAASGQTMKIDGHTKTLLTVIAGLLALLLLRPIVTSTPSYAANPVQYKAVDARGGSVETVLNQHGKEGWEVVWVYTSGMHLLKRSQ